jgi:hypothetical protein
MIRLSSLAPPPPRPSMLKCPALGPPTGFLPIGVAMQSSQVICSCRLASVGSHPDLLSPRLRKTPAAEEPPPWSSIIS